MYFFPIFHRTRTAMKILSLSRCVRVQSLNRGCPISVPAIHECFHPFYVLNGTAGVREPVRCRVLEVVRSTSYQPSQVGARSSARPNQRHRNTNFKALLRTRSRRYESWQHWRTDKCSATVRDGNLPKAEQQHEFDYRPHSRSPDHRPSGVQTRCYSTFGST